MATELASWDAVADETVITTAAGLGLSATNWAVVSTSGTMTVDQDDKVGSHPALKIALSNAGSGANYLQRANMSSTAFGITVILKIVTAPSGELYLAGPYIGSTRKCSVGIGGADFLKIVVRDSGLRYTSPSLTINTWYAVELFATPESGGGANGIIRVRITNLQTGVALVNPTLVTASTSTGVNTGSPTGLTGTAAFTHLRAGRSNTSTLSGEVRIAYVYLDPAASDMIGTPSTAQVVQAPSMALGIAIPLPIEGFYGSAVSGGGPMSNAIVVQPPVIKYGRRTLADATAAVSTAMRVPSVLAASVGAVSTPAAQVLVALGQPVVKAGVRVTAVVATMTLAARAPVSKLPRIAVAPAMAIALAVRAPSSTRSIRVGGVLMSLAIAIRTPNVHSDAPTIGKWPLEPFPGYFQTDPVYPSAICKELYAIVEDVSPVHYHPIDVAAAAVVPDPETPGGFGSSFGESFGES